MINFKDIKLGTDFFGTRKNKEEVKKMTYDNMYTEDEDDIEDDDELGDNDCGEDEILDYDGNLITNDKIISIADNLISTKSKFTVFDVAVILVEEDYAIGSDTLDNIDGFLAEYFRDNYEKYKIARTVKGEYHEFTLADLEGEMLVPDSSLFKLFLIIQKQALL